MRVYSVEFHNVSVLAVQDLISVTCTASMAIKLHGVVIGQITGTTVQGLQVSIHVLPATVTAGSGGSAATPQKMTDTDAAATATARINDTTPATTSGAVSVKHSDVFNVVNGYQWFPPREDRPSAKLSEALVLSLDSAPSSGLVMSGTLYFEELF